MIATFLPNHIIYLLE